MVTYSIWKQDNLTLAYLASFITGSTLESHRREDSAAENQVSSFLFHRVKATSERPVFLRVGFQMVYTVRGREMYAIYILYTMAVKKVVHIPSVLGVIEMGVGFGTQIIQGLSQKSLGNLTCQLLKMLI